MNANRPARGEATPPSLAEHHVSDGSAPSTPHDIDFTQVRSNKEETDSLEVSRAWLEKKDTQAGYGLGNRPTIPEQILETTAAQPTPRLTLDETEVVVPAVEQHQPKVGSETWGKALVKILEDIRQHITSGPKDDPQSYVFSIKDSGYETVTCEQSLEDMQFNNPIKAETSSLNDERTDDSSCSDMASIITSDRENYAAKVAGDLLSKLCNDDNIRGQLRGSLGLAMERITGKLEQLLIAFALKIGRSSYDSVESQIRLDVMVFVYRNRKYASSLLVVWG